METHDWYEMVSKVEATFLTIFGALMSVLFFVKVKISSAHSELRFAHSKSWQEKHPPRHGESCVFTE